LGKIGDNILPGVKLAAVGLNEALIDIQSFLESPKFQQAAVQAGAFLKAAFISATTEISLEINNLKFTFLEFAKFFQKQAVAISKIPFAFSDETKQNSLNNLKEIESGIAAARDRIEDLSGSDKRFAVQFEIAKQEAEELLKTLGDVSGAIGGGGGKGGSGGGLKGEAKLFSDELKEWIIQTELAKLGLDKYSEAMGLLKGDVQFIAEQFELISKTPISTADALAKARAVIDPNQPLSPQDELTRSDDVGEIDAKALAKERLARAEEALGKAMSASSQVASTYGQKLSQAYAEGATGAKAYARAAVETAKEVIAAQIREGVVTAATKALAKVPFPFNIVLAGIAAGAAEALFRGLLSKIKIPAFGDGGVVYGPTLALIGEKGPEAIVPLGKGGTNAIDVTIRGVQYGTDTYWQNANAGILGRMIYGPR
jgi:hypothetical protein